MPKSKRWPCWLMLLPLALSAPALGAPFNRFFISGDGRIQIRSTKNQHRFSGRYRNPDGSYNRRALKKINRVFDSSAAQDHDRISLRLIERLAFLRSQLKGGWITIASGYRSPQYNQSLRDRGGTVAKASLHLFGMAADLRIQGVDSKAAWEFIRDQRLGGGGYYNSPWFHFDVGPARSWTQGTANVRKGLSDHNKRIILVPEFDIYRSGEPIKLRFAMMTAFPIGLKREGLILERQTGDSWRFVSRARLKAKRGESCLKFNSTAAMAGIPLAPPRGAPSGVYRVRAVFCQRTWPAMPEQITSNDIELKR